jgi:hypothetical protein
LQYWFDPDRLLRAGLALHERYDAAEPFPHIVLEDFLPPERVDAILEAFPAPDSPYWSTKDQPDSKKQDTTPDYVAELKMPPAIREAMWQFNSSLFLFFLHHLTGIRGLTGDPWLYGGGIHQILPGGLLKIHADFNIHEFTGLLRRINVLVYLNKDWQDEWGGHLELWDTEMSRCVRRVAPNAGTCVIFNTSSTSYHGHPDPLRCPPGRTRKSLAFYYYTIDPEFDPRGKLHSTLWRKRPGEDY